jgi:hypothetical protein
MISKAAIAVEYEARSQNGLSEWKLWDHYATLASAEEGRAILSRKTSQPTRVHVTIYLDLTPESRNDEAHSD